MDLLTLANIYDKHGLYRTADFIQRYALDLTDINDLESKSGSYGKFVSDIPKDVRKKLKDQIGPVPDNVGIKQYFTPTSYDNSMSNLTENLALLFISPWINKLTDLNSPVVNQYLPLSQMISKKIVVTQKMPGQPIWYLRDKLDVDFYTAARVTTEKGIIRKLDAIGVGYDDLHNENYLVNQTKCNELSKKSLDTINTKGQFDHERQEYPSTEYIIMEMKQIYGPEVFDLSTGASLFDFGAFTCLPGSQPGASLLAFQKQIQSNPSYENNSMLRQIVSAIDQIVY